MAPRFSIAGLGSPLTTAEAWTHRDELWAIDRSPTRRETLVPRNYGRAPALISVNLRIGKAIGFGPLKESASKPAQSGSAPAPLGPVTNQGLRGLLGSPSARDGAIT